MSLDHYPPSVLSSLSSGSFENVVVLMGEGASRASGIQPKWGFIRREVMERCHELRGGLFLMH